MEAWENRCEGPAQGEETQEKERGGHVAGFGDSFNSGCIVLKVVAFFLNFTWKGGIQLAAVTTLLLSFLGIEASPFLWRG